MEDYRFEFEILCSRDINLQGKILQQAIDEYNYLAPGITKHVKLLPTLYWY